MAEKNKVEVKIAGKEYTLIGNEPEEYLQKIALHVDRKISEIMKINSRLSTNAAAILACINIMDECFKTCENEARLKERLDYLTSELERIKQENKYLQEENNRIVNQNSNLQLELAKREAELNEVRNSLQEYKYK